MKKFFYSLLAIFAIALAIFISGCDHRYTVTFIDYDGTVLAVESVRENRTVYPPDEPSREDYIFIGWDKPLENITIDTEIKALYQPKKVTVTFKDYNGMIFKVDQIAYGKSATAPVDPVREGHIFLGWDQPFTNVTRDLIVNALYQAEIYQVTFVGYDGEVLDEQEIAYGETAMAPVANEIDGYDFIGWSEEFSIISGDMYIEAIYQIKSYQVIYKDYNNMIFKVDQVIHGRSSYPPTSPSRVGYTFSGWDKTADYVVSDMEIKANYEVNKFTVIFKNEENQNIKEEVISYGESAQAPDIVVEGYDFLGWDQNFSFVTSDLVVSPVLKIKTYQVTFKDNLNMIFKTETVEHGSQATPPTNYQKEGYTFSCWDNDFSNVTSDLIVIGLYDINTFNVIFKDSNGEIIAEQTISFGSDATLPNEPIKTGYNFIGWDQDWKNVKSDFIVTAQYQIKKYLVKFLDNNNQILKVETVDHGSSATMPTNYQKEGFTFLYWDKPFNNIIDNAEIRGIYQINTYTVIFKNESEEISRQTISFGSDAALPAEPIKTGYNFTGWDKDWKNVKSDIEINANFEIMKFQVSFIDYNGMVYKIQTVEYGQNATSPNVLERTGYKFTGWDKEFTNVNSNLVVSATYQKKSFEVTFLNYDDTIINSQIVLYDEAAVEPVVGNRVGYDFYGWTISFNNIKEDTMVKAVYKIKEFNVIFQDESGLIYKTEKVEYGKDATSPDAIIKEGYTFIGWSALYTNVTSNLTLTALYQINKYTVTFETNGGSLINPIQDINYLQTISLPVPVKTGYDFIGWYQKNDLLNSPNFTNSTPVTSDLTLYARWRIVYLKYVIESHREVTIVGYNGQVTEIVIPEYIDDYQVTKIDANCFKGKNTITSIYLPSSVKEIGNSAFGNMVNLNSLTISAINCTFGASVLLGTNNLSTLTIPGNISLSYLYGSNADLIPLSLKTINVSEGSTFLCDYFLKGARFVESVYIPSSVTTLGQSLLEGSNVSTIDLSQTTISVISDKAFQNANRLETISLPETLREIGQYAFANSALTQITLPNSVSTILAGAFMDVKELIEIVIPNNVTVIEYGTFKNALKLTYVTLPSSLIYITNNAFENTNLYTLTIPNSVVHIGDYAFYNVKNITTLELPTNLKVIGEYAFSGLNISQIVIPYKVTTIGSYAFYNCENLEDARILRSFWLVEKINFGINIFDGTKPNFDIQVPTDSVDKYSENPNISKYIIYSLA